MICIKAKKAGFRRCGMAHPAEWVEHPHDAFSDDQLRHLLAEPMLIVVVRLDEPSPLAAKGEGQEARDEDDNVGAGLKPAITPASAKQTKQTKQTKQRPD